MLVSFRPLIAGLSAIALVSFTNIIKPGAAEKKITVNDPAVRPKIQVALLLDVSNSMDGLIEQAKAQLWNMVTVMGKAKCNDVSPVIEIALYEYGRDSNDPNAGYIRQVSNFSSDLDSLSQQLFRLTTYGGSEYCGYVIHTSLNDLKWDNNNTSYKVIFIAGNEDFLQGNISYTTSCSEAKTKGVVVNTIYCGDRMQGIAEHWNLGAECGNGSYTNINSDAKPVDIPTPYDTTLIVLSNKLNSTYVYFGESGKYRAEMQYETDNNNSRVNTSVAAKRAAVKGNRGLYDNASWDLVDAYEKDKTIIDKVDMKTLPDSLKNLSRAQLRTVVDENNKNRSAIQRQIAETNSKRDAFISKERAKAAGENAATLETEVEKIIREQVKRYNMSID